MTDTTLCSQLLGACGPETHVLFVGDPDQLSPVGHGAPLRDMIAAGVPCGHLTKIRRNSGRIVRACKQIAETKRFTPSKSLDLNQEDPENLIFLAAKTPEEQYRILSDLFARLSRQEQHDPIRDAQVLCAVNKKSQIGRRQLNEFLQAELNPNGARCDKNPFRTGDKIICGQNGPLTMPGKPEQTWVANGEQGIVEQVEPTYTIARLAHPDRLVRIPLGRKQDKETSQDDEGKSRQWQLAYAITCHKSQGSEWPIVVFMADSSAAARRIVDRHHVYTGFSRTKTFCVIIGTMNTVLAACRRSNMWQRKTFLREQIRVPAAGIEDLF